MRIYSLNHFDLIYKINFDDIKCLSFSYKSNLIACGGKESLKLFNFDKNSRYFNDKILNYS